MSIRSELPAPIRSDPARQGSSLLEVMVAAVVLAVIVIGAGAYQALSSAQVTAQRDRRAATAFAESRLEEIRATSYNGMKALMPSPSTYNTYYLSRNGAGWNLFNADPGEVVTNHGFARPITTTLRSTSPRSILWNACSTSPIEIVSLTNRSRSSRPCW